MLGVLFYISPYTEVAEQEAPVCWPFLGLNTSQLAGFVLLGMRLAWTSVTLSCPQPMPSSADWKKDCNKQTVDSSTRLSNLPVH
jgi:hypothetical protein